MNRYLCFRLETVKVLFVSQDSFSHRVDAYSEATRYTKGFCLPGGGGLLAKSIIASLTVAVKRQVCRVVGT